ncbi:YafY family transcriptional regulator [Paenibacillus sp. sptzw28]|uniref:helix-turn-helix transcriptional regulator n=1 Tax=Paenibacillus sp. sptzw28 TaxID=715179 RepID=UPI001C6E359A|nr:YafY family protein [Paenibacillus sp. sptzw28]QYR21943.1 YafY family transcriptional regulator [Paenibacillus sp. sptzw28]
MSKSDNLLAVLWLLSSRKRMTAAQLAEELELSVRTVYRYIDALCASGVPVVAEPGHDGGYSLLSHFVEAPLFFDEDERKSIVHAALFAEQAGYPHRDALDRALNKIKLYTNKEQLEALMRHTRGFNVLAPLVSAPAPDEPVLRRLELAVADSLSVTMDYRKSETDETTRRVDPYGLVHWSGKWYLVAYCHLRGEIRSFRIDRISALNENGETFERPHPFSAGDYFIERLRPKAPPEETLTDVRIEGEADAVRHICESAYMRFFLREQSEGKALFQLDAAMVSRYLPNMLLPYGSSIRVVEPQSLREELAATAAELARFYQADLNK